MRQRLGGRVELPPPSDWYKVWFALCAVIGLGVLGVGVWAVIVLVNWVTNH